MRDSAGQKQEHEALFFKNFRTIMLSWEDTSLRIEWPYWMTYVCMANIPTLKLASQVAEVT